MSLAAPAYLERVDVAALFARLAVPDAGGLARAALDMDDAAARVEEEGVLATLGGAGIEALADGLLAAGALNPAPALLDLAARGGEVSARLDGTLRARGLRPHWSAMAPASACLRRLEGGKAVPFLGHIGDIEGSVREATLLQPLPARFDGAFAAFALSALAEHEGAIASALAGAAGVLGHGAPLLLVERRDDVDPDALATEAFQACDVRDVAPGVFLAELRR